VKLQGRIAVVTGAGRGIGAAVARALAAEGAAVALCARTKAQLVEVAEAITAEGGTALPFACDVADEGSVQAMAAAVRSALGPVDVLVNNAGVAHSAPLARTTLSDWNRILAVNATGTFLCTQAFVPDMVARRWGRVVNVASTAARMGARYIGAYAASKHAVLGFTRSIAAEVAASGVTVNAVCPGYVDTEMTRETVDRIVAKTGRSADEALAQVLATSPQKRLLGVDEVAFAVLTLCDHGARGINGQAVVLDGGELLS
jgi:NAD(P)-dependent dehydrogenase (short-subunit alcohol dehydrogenase family)